VHSGCRRGSEELSLIFEKGEFKGFDDKLFDNPVEAIQAPEKRVEGYGLGRDNHHNAFCVEEVNRLVGEGVPFRDAYRQVGKAVQEGSFHFSGKLQHSHEGSIGNLCNDRIAERFHRILSTLQKG
jgi:argininosuccinate lyase